MSFFITSSGPGKGAALDGLAGADQHCQALPKAVGAGNKTWRAYLSAAAADGQPAVNARDRIGTGPWQNFKGEIVAKGVDDLHSDGNKLNIETALTEQEQGQSVPFVVRDARGTVVGSTRYMTIEHWTWLSAPAEPVPNGPDAVEIGFTWYAERVQRTALNTEAKVLLCTHAFEHWRVSWKTDSRNERSRAAILRLGARLDGVLRAHRPAADGTVRDTAFYSMLASEWPEARRELERRLDAR
jgi:RimJ/RimL family protein N-acetyltransferase